MPTAMHSSKRSLNSNSTLSKQDVPSSASTQKEGIAREFYRDGVTDGIESTVVNDHDFPSASSGKVIPHGIYDLARDEASLHLNSSRDTSELACESIELWWREQGPPCRRVAGSLRWWRQQQFVAILVQRGFAGTIEPAGTENLHCTLPAVLFEIQSDRTPRISSRHTSLQRRPSGDHRDCKALHRKNRNDDRPECRRADHRQSLRNRTQIRRRLQEDDDDRVRQTSPKMELYRDSRYHLISGIYFGTVP